MIKALLDLPRVGKQMAVIVLDVLLAVLATWLAFSLRLDTLHWPMDAQGRVYWLAPLMAIPVFIRLGLYRAIFRYTGLAALLAIAKAVAIYGSALFLLLVWQRWLEVPRSIGVLQPILFLLLAGGSRALARFWLAGIGRNRVASEGRLLIYGAGESGVQTAAAIGNARKRPDAASTERWCICRRRSPMWYAANPSPIFCWPCPASRAHGATRSSRP